MDKNTKYLDDNDREFYIEVSDKGTLLIESTPYFTEINHPSEPQQSTHKFSRFPLAHTRHKQRAAQALAVFPDLAWLFLLGIFADRLA